jgi:two-component system response regulator ChvI
MGSAIWHIVYGCGRLSPHAFVSLTLKTNPIRVLFVEDDEDYRETVSDELSEHGFVVHSFADGDSLLGSLNTATDADVIVLDWGLPKISGIDLIPQLRRHGVNLPVVFLTGHALIAHESQAFARGAVDFIDKTRGVEVLVRRLKLVADTGKPAANPDPDERIVCGKLVLKPTISRAYWREVDIGLTVTEYNIVHFLTSNAGRDLTYRDIYDRMRYEGFIAGLGDLGYRTNVRSAIKRIRNKFRELDSTFNEIENSAALGYRWRGPSVPPE